MSNRPAKKKKEVEITHEDFDVEWTPPPRTARDRIIQVGVAILIVAFLLPAVTCAVSRGSRPSSQQQQQAQQSDEVEQAIQRYSQDLQKNPKDPAILANLGYYTNQKAQRIHSEDPKDNARMTLLATAEKYLRDSLAQDEDYLFAKSELAKNLMLQGKTEEADSLIESAMEKADKNIASEDESVAADAKNQKVQLLLLSAESDRQKEDNKAALDKLNQVVELKPGDPQMYLTRGDFQRLIGDKEAARKDFEMVVDIAQKTGNQQMAQIGQIMIEQLDKPAVVPTPDVSGTPGAATQPAPETSAAPE